MVTGFQTNDTTKTIFHVILEVDFGSGMAQKWLIAISAGSKLIEPDWTSLNFMSIFVSTLFFFSKFPEELKKFPPRLQCHKSSKKTPHRSTKTSENMFMSFFVFFLFLRPKPKPKTFLEPLASRKIQAEIIHRQEMKPVLLLNGYFFSFYASQTADGVLCWYMLKYLP